MKIIYLLRGLPGSGKSTLASNLNPNGVRLEADSYFNKEGEYKFDASKLKEAHEWCKTECEKAMGWELMITVSNTFTQEWEMASYFELAKKYGYKIFSIIVENRHNGQNIHDVPNETIEKMKKRFEIKL